MTVVAYEEEGFWIAQCLEHDICVQAPTREALRHRLGLTIEANIAINEHLGRIGLDGIPPAPAKFWDYPRF